MQQVETISFDSLVTPALSKGASVRNDFPGFREDYLALHCLIRKYKPQSFFEIGTSSGRGTKVICKAMSRRRFWPDTRERVYSLDVPPGTDSSILYPDGEDGHPARTGSKNPYPYTQVFGDSMTLDVSPYLPIDGWFIDGKHDYEHARSETLTALSTEPSIIIWHDMQIDGVLRGVSEAMLSAPDYRNRRIDGTRIGYAVLSRLD